MRVYTLIQTLHNDLGVNSASLEYFIQHVQSWSKFYKIVNILFNLVIKKHLEFK